MEDAAATHARARATHLDIINHIEATLPATTFSDFLAQDEDATQQESSRLAVAQENLRRELTAKRKSLTESKARLDEVKALVQECTGEAADDRDPNSRNRTELQALRDAATRTFAELLGFPEWVLDPERLKHAEACMAGKTMQPVAYFPATETEVSRLVELAGNPDSGRGWSAEVLSKAVRRVGDQMQRDKKAIEDLQQKIKEQNSELASSRDALRKETAASLQRQRDDAVERAEALQREVDHYHDQSDDHAVLLGHNQYEAKNEKRKLLVVTMKLLNAADGATLTDLELRELRHVLGIPHEDPDEQPSPADFIVANVVNGYINVTAPALAVAECVQMAMAPPLSHPPTNVNDITLLHRRALSARASLPRVSPFLLKYLCEALRNSRGLRYACTAAACQTMLSYCPSEGLRSLVASAAEATESTPGMVTATARRRLQRFVETLDYNEAGVPDFAAMLMNDHGELEGEEGVWLMEVRLEKLDMVVIREEDSNTRFYLKDGFCEIRTGDLKLIAHREAVYVQAETELQAGQHIAWSGDLGRLFDKFVWEHYHADVTQAQIDLLDQI